MHGTGGAPFRFRFAFAKAFRPHLQLAGKAGSLLRVLSEERFQLRIVYRIGRFLEALLPIFKSLDQVIDCRDNFFLICHILSIARRIPLDWKFLPTMSLLVETADFFSCQTK